MRIFANSGRETRNFRLLKGSRCSIQNLLPYFLVEGGAEMKRYTIFYQAEIEAKDMDEAEDLAEKGEIKIRSRLVKIEGDDGEVRECVNREA
jgi:hypothetical protein